MNDDHPTHLQITWKSILAERERVQRMEEQLIQRALLDAAGVVSRAARSLGIPRSTLVSRMEILGIDRDESLRSIG
jgi:DNA-binding NtrC family response regulator